MCVCVCVCEIFAIENNFSSEYPQTLGNNIRCCAASPTEYIYNIYRSGGALSLSRDRMSSAHLRDRIYVYTPRAYILLVKHTRARVKGRKRILAWLAIPRDAYLIIQQSPVASRCRYIILTKAIVPCECVFLTFNIYDYSYGLIHSPAQLFWLKSFNANHECDV